MMRSKAELQSIRDSVNWVGKLSDNILHVGPLTIGVDAVLTWIPGVGELYSTAAGAFIVVQGARAGVPWLTLAGAAAILALRTTASAVPLVGEVFAGVFTAHKWAAKMIINSIDRQIDMGAQPAREWAVAHSGA
jgi:hypothetical protein